MIYAQGKDKEAMDYNKDLDVNYLLKFTFEKVCVICILTA